MQYKPVQLWKYLMGVLAVFWTIFAIFLLNADIPFLAVSMGLAMVLAMSAVVVGLAWAYQKKV